MRLFKDDKMYKAHVFLPSTTNPAKKERMFKFINSKGKQEALVIMADTEEKLIDKCRSFIEKLISNKEKSDYVVIDVPKIGTSLKFQPLEIVAPSETNILNVEDIYIIYEHNTKQKSYRAINIIGRSWGIIDLPIEEIDDNYYAIGRLPNSIATRIKDYETTKIEIGNSIKKELDKVIVDIQKSYSDIYHELNDKIDKMDDVPYIIKERMKELLIDPNQEEDK